MNINKYILIAAVFIVIIIVIVAVGVVDAFTGPTAPPPSRDAGQLLFSLDGKLGIDTSTPAEKLDVFGNIKASGAFIGTYSGSFSAANVIGPSAFGVNYGTYNYAFPGALAIGTSTTSGLPNRGLYVEGNVGIGTMNPGARLDVAGTIKASGNYYNVVSWNFNGTITNAVKIKTNIPFTNSSQMPTVIIEGYDFGNSNTIGISLVWYILGDNFINHSASSWGNTTPTIRLANENGLVTITLDWRPYYGRMTVRVFAQGVAENPNWFNGWTVVDEVAGTRNQVTLSYRNTFPGTVNFANGIWNSSGNVGIGTTAPGARLELASDGTTFTYPTMGLGKGSMHLNPVAGTNNNTVSLTFGANGGSSIVNSGQAGIYVQSSGAYGTKMYFGTTNSYAAGSQARMMIDHVGNVGIGTTEPKYKLQVDGSDAAPSDGAQIVGIRSNLGTQLAFGVYEIGNYAWLRSYESGVGERNLVLQPLGGRVGIGTTTPATALHVIGTVTATNFSGSFTGSSISAANVTGPSAFGVNYGTYNYAFPGALAIGASTTSGLPSEGLYVKGNVGIGTTEPKYKLQVDGSDAAPSDGAQIVGIRSNLGTQLAFGVYEIGNYAWLRSYESYESEVGERNLVLQPLGGNVGIGTTTPATALHVIGTVTATNFSGSFTGSFSAANVTGPSAFGVNYGTYNYAFPGALAIGASTTSGLPNEGLYVKGNVGIGTTGPVNRLSVSGGASIGSEYTGTTAPTNGMIIQGDVGIGMTSPTARLLVRGATNNSSTIAFRVQDSSGTNILNIRNDRRISMGNSGNNDWEYLGEVLTVSHVSSRTSDWIVLTEFGINASPSSGSNATYFGLRTTASSNSANMSSASLTSNYVRSDFGSNQALNRMTGSFVDLRNNNAGTVNNIHGILVNTTNSSGTISNLNVFHYGHNTNTGTINNFYGLRIDSVAGTKTNYYGVYLASQSSVSGNNYGIYVDDTNARNYFGGRVGIRTTTPLTELHVNGTITATKIDVNTIDPIYTIDGVRYATYMAGMTGVKEETTGILNLKCQSSNLRCENIIDFVKASVGSDLWLFAKTTNLEREGLKNVVMLLTPNFKGKVWYEKDEKNNRIVVYAAPEKESENSLLEVSYRLTAPRFDHEKSRFLKEGVEKFGNLYTGLNEGFNLNKLLK